MTTQGSGVSTRVDEVVNFLVETFRSYNAEAPETWAADTAIDTVGIDSFDFVEILFKIEDHYAVDLGYNANIKFSALTTIRDLAEHIVQITSRKIAA